MFSERISNPRYEDLETGMAALIVSRIANPVFSERISNPRYEDLETGMAALIVGRIANPVFSERISNPRYNEHSVETPATPRGLLGPVG